MSKDFMESFKSNDTQTMRDYLIQFGKKPKPICPIIFGLEDNNDQDEWQSNGDLTNSNNRK